MLDCRFPGSIRSRGSRLFAMLSVCLLIASGSAIATSETPLMLQAAQPPAVLEYSVVRSLPHDRGAFTQGLIWRDGFFYESTGLNGRSSLRKVNPESGEVLQHETVPREFFAEGLTDWKDKLIQLTWQSGRAFVYERKSFKRSGEFNYPGEGWGITHDGKHLIMSDGSASLRFLDPDSYQQTAALEVTYQGKPLANLNELEFVRGRIFANVWQSNSIVVIDPESGRVIAQINLAGLLSDDDRAGGVDVLNGIAYDAKHDHLYVTGKLWPKVFEIRLKPTDLLDKPR